MDHEHFSRLINCLKQLGLEYTTKLMGETTVYRFTNPLDQQFIMEFRSDPYYVKGPTIYPNDNAGKKCILCKMDNDTEYKLCSTCRSEIYHEVAMENVDKESSSCQGCNYYNEDENVCDGNMETDCPEVEDHS